MKKLRVIKEGIYLSITYHKFNELKKDIDACNKFYKTKHVTLKMGLKIPS